MSDVSEPTQTQAEPLAYRVARGGLLVAFSSYLNVGFGFLANLVLTRILAPEQFGIFALAGFFFSLVNLRPKLGVGQAFAQREETTGELLGTHLALDVSAGLLTLVLAGAAVPILRGLGYPWDVAWVVLALAGVGVSDSIMGTAWVLLDKELRFGRSSLVSGLVFPLSYLPAFWLAVRGWGYWSLLAQNAAYALLLLVGMWWTARRQLPQLWRLRWRFDRQVAIQFVHFGAMVGLATLAGMLLTQFDNFLVGTFVSMAVLGFYDRAYRIAQWPSLLVSSVVTRTAFYTYARLQDDPARLQKTVVMVLWLITTLALPLALAIFVSAPDLVSLLFGARWRPSAIFVRFLVVYSLLRPVSDNAASLFFATGHPRWTTVTRVIQAVVLIATATPLTLAYGATGTCVGVGVAFTVGLVITYRYARQAVAFSAGDALLAPVMAAALALAAYWLLTRSLDLNALPLAVRVIAKAGFAGAAFCVLLFAVHPRQTIERVAYVRRLLLGVRGTAAAD